eukprot:298658-Hanusia_phi.AAC.1
MMMAPAHGAQCAGQPSVQHQWARLPRTGQASEALRPPGRLGRRAARQAFTGHGLSAVAQCRTR